MFERIDSLGIKFNDFCNLNCKYCFESIDSRSKHNVFNKNEELLQFLKNTNIGSRLFVNLLGGEVTLYPRELYNLCKQIKKIERYKDTTVDIGIISNGTNHNFIMDDLIKIITPKFLKISWDGMHASNIAQTHLTDKQLSTIVDKVGNSIYNEDVLIAIAVTKDNLVYLADSIQYALEHGCRHISYYFIFSDEYFEYYSSKEFTNTFTHQLHRIYLLYKQYDFILENLTYLIYNKYINTHFNYKHACGRMGRMLIVDPFGDIYPCLVLREYDILENIKNFKIGNIETGLDTTSIHQFEEYYNTLIKSINNSCHGCIDMPYCVECPLDIKYMYDIYQKCMFKKNVYNLERQAFDKYITKNDLNRNDKKFNLDYYNKEFIPGSQYITSV